MIDNVRRAINREYLTARVNAESQLSVREAEAIARDAQLGAILAKRRDCLPKAAMDAMRNKTYAKDIMRAAKADYDALSADIAAHLAALDLPPDHLLIKHECAECGDTGFLPNGERCSCYGKRISELAQLDIELTFGASFDAFDASIFPDRPLPDQTYSQRAYMDALKGAAMRYSDAFPYNPKAHIMLSGRTGVGKSYLIECIARRVKERGFIVVKLPAYKLVDMLRRYHTGQDTEWEIDRLYDCDLLAIDDIGTEPMMRNVTIEYLFMIINERMTTNRAMLLATNLNHADLTTRYNERVSSRLTDATRVSWYDLNGDDARHMKGAHSK